PTQVAAQNPTKHRAWQLAAFPPPCTAEEVAGGYVVRDANKQALVSSDGSSASCGIIGQSSANIYVDVPPGQKRAFDGSVSLDNMPNVAALLPTIQWGPSAPLHQGLPALSRRPGHPWHP